MLFRHKILAVIFFFTLLCSCSSKEIHTPSLYFKTGAPYTPDGSVVAYNAPMTFGLVADGGGANISMIKVTVESEAGTRTMLDSGTNTAVLDWSRLFSKGDGWNEVWTFTVMNRDREQASLSLRITKDSASTYGPILSYPSIILGMQNNTTVRNFYDPMNNLLYFPAEVTAALEGTIDVACYYDASDSYTIFSPGCALSESYYPIFSSWAVRNYTAWDVHTVVSAAAFDQATNDSLLVASYDEAYGKKKYKFLAADIVVPFKTAAGKKGMVKIISTGGNETGTVEMALKIQQ